MIITITCSRCGFVFYAKEEKDISEAQKEFIAWGGTLWHTWTQDKGYQPSAARCVFCSPKPKLIGNKKP